MRYYPRGKKSLLQKVRRAGQWLCLLMLLALIAAQLLGLPVGLLRWAVQTLADGEIAVELKRARFSFLDGIELRGLEVYQCGVVGPPAYECGRMVLKPHVLASIRERRITLTVKCMDGHVRPKQFATTDTPRRPGRIVTPLCIHVMSHNVGLAELKLASLSCHVDLAENKISVENILGTIRARNVPATFSGRVNYAFESNLLDAHVRSQLDPHLLIPLCEARGLKFVGRLIRRFNFKGSAPHCELDILMPCTRNGAVDVWGTVSFAEATYRGVPVTSSDGTLNVRATSTNTIVEVDPLVITREEGEIRGGLIVDVQRDEVEFYAESSLDPRAIMGMLNLFSSSLQQYCRFEPPMDFHAYGRVDYDDLSDTDFWAAYVGGPVRVGSLQADECSFEMRMTGTTDRLTDIRAKGYGGTLSGTAAFDISPTADGMDTFVAEAVLDGANFGSLAADLSTNAPPRMQGVLSGTATLRGDMEEDWLKRLRGNAKLTIEDGRVFSLPLFGGLSQFMSRVIPGLDFVLRQSNASADLTVADGIITSDKVNVEGGVLSLRGHGTVTLEGELDYQVQLTLMREHSLVAKLLRLVTYPVSKLFEFRLRGPIENPEWYPTNFSTDLLKKLATPGEHSQEGIDHE